MAADTVLTFRQGDHRVSFKSLIIAATLALSAGASANAAVIDFEDLSDGALAPNTYAGVTISGADILTSGISLNEFEFPPKSGTKVAYNSGGAISFDFSGFATAFSLYVTGTENVTLSIFDGATLLGSATTGGPNYVSIGSPNFLLSLSGAHITNATLSAANVGDFVIDDVSFSAGVPEPETWAMMLGGFALTGLVLRRRRDLATFNA